MQVRGEERISEKRDRREGSPAGAAGGGGADEAGVDGTGTGVGGRADEAGVAGTGTEVGGRADEAGVTGAGTGVGGRARGFPAWQVPQRREAAFRRRQRVQNHLSMEARKAGSGTQPRGMWMDWMWLRREEA